MNCTVFLKVWTVITGFILPIAKLAICKFLYKLTFVKIQHLDNKILFKRVILKENLMEIHYPFINCLNESSIQCEF